MIRFFNLMKNNKTKDNMPDYRISFQVDETYVEGGACWIKKDKSGNTFLSCKLSEPYNDKRGWFIEAEEGKKKQEETLEF